jgi:MurNAc alpha-1-phosphate uridylyltransferase
MLPVAILCGGKGTRIARLAGDLPKALIPVGGVPFLAHQLRWLRDAGATDVVLLTGYRGERIRDYAGDGSAWGLRIAYSDDGDAPRGTAGAVASALPLLGDAFLTVYGDALLTADPARVADALVPPYEGVMTVFRNDDRWLPSNVRVAGERVADYDKQALPGTMTHIDYGINAFTAAPFAGAAARSRPVDLAEVHRALIARATLRALAVSERWYEIGSPEGLDETERFVRRTMEGHQSA